jgi:lycopene cyclase domain-containing protein
MTYTEAALLAVALAVLLDLTVLGTRLVGRTAFWVSYGIVLFFQLIVNGLLTGLKIVRYDSAQILGPRLAFAPVEDLLFGFALVTLTLSVWVWVGRRMPAGRRGAQARHGAGR